MKRSRLRATLALLTALFASSAARAATLELPCLRDATLFEDADGDTASGSGPHLYAGDTQVGNTRRALLFFDAAGALGAKSVVQSVELRLNVSRVPDPTPRSVTLHRLRSDWGEGTSVSEQGAGAPAEPDDATWIHAFYPDRRWALPGGDFETLASASAPAVLGPLVLTGPGLVADVQAWVDGTTPEYGWLVRGVEGTPFSVRRIDAREATDPQRQPVLVIEYTPATPVEDASWSAVKAATRRR